jgi:hypothetical protein
MPASADDDVVVHRDPERARGADDRPRHGQPTEAGGFAGGGRDRAGDASMLHISKK